MIVASPPSCRGLRGAPIQRSPCKDLVMMEFSGPADRHQTVAVKVGKVSVGGGAPVVVQSMTNTDTADVAATVKQVAALARAGSEIVRITVNNEASAAAVAPIVEQLD